MRVRVRLLLAGMGAVVVSAAILAACDGPVVKPLGCKGAACRDADESDDAPSHTVDSVCSDVASAYCDQFERCTPFTLELTHKDLATCIEREKMKCEIGLTAPGTGATPTRLAECAAARRTFSCEATWARERPEACAIVGGAFDDGKPCVDSAQCKNRLCRIGSQNSCGLCASLGAIGDACETSSECETPLDCVSKKCVALGKMGDSCAGNACSSQLRCIGGKCLPPNPAGTTCEWGDGVPDTCDRLNGYFCNLQNMKCAPIDTSEPGGRCSFSESATRYCAGGGYCKIPPDAGGVGTCDAPAADGASCNSKTCAIPARCVSGLCALPNPAACH